jgi:hypothetical protein
MKVDFYQANEQNAPTVEHYLFTKEKSQVMNGEYIENAGQYYQVISQTMADPVPVDDQNEWLPIPPPVVFVYPVQRRPIEFDTF